MLIIPKKMRSQLYHFTVLCVKMTIKTYNKMCTNKKNPHTHTSSNDGTPNRMNLLPRQDNLESFENPTKLKMVRFFLNNNFRSKALAGQTTPQCLGVGAVANNSPARWGARA